MLRILIREVYYDYKVGPKYKYMYFFKREFDWVLKQANRGEHSTHRRGKSDFGVDHLVKSICRVFSCVVWRGCLLWPVHSLGNLLAFALFHFVFQGQTCQLLQVSLDFLLSHSNPLWWKGCLVRGISSRRSCRSSHNCSASTSSTLVVGA